MVPTCIHVSDGASGSQHGALTESKHLHGRRVDQSIQGATYQKCGSQSGVKIAHILIDSVTPNQIFAGQVHAP